MLYCYYTTGKRMTTAGDTILL